MEGGESALRRVFAEIIAGVSPAKLFDKEVYFKHPSLLETAEADKFHQEFWDKGFEEGLLPEKDKLQTLIECELWTKEKEVELETLEVVSKSIQKGLAAQNLIAPAQIKQQQNELKETDRKIKEIQVERETLLGMTLETYVANELNFLVILSSIYKDINLRRKLFKPKEIEEVEPEELDQIYRVYFDINNKFSPENLKELAVSDMFSSRLELVGGDLYKFFGFPMIRLTNYQYLLGFFGDQYFKITNNTPNIPEEVRNNYDKLVQWVKSNKPGAPPQQAETIGTSLLEEAQSTGKTKLNKRELAAKLMNM